MARLGLFDPGLRQVTLFDDTLVVEGLVDTELIDVGQSIGTISHLADALLKATQQTTHGTDADLKKTFSVAHGTDSFLAAPPTFNRAHQADALLKAFFSRSYGTDTSLKATLAIAHGTDAQLYVQSAVSHTSSSLLEAAIDRAHGTSSWLKLVLYRKVAAPSDSSSVVPPPTSQVAPILSTPQIADGTGQVSGPAGSGTTGAPASGTIVGDTEQSRQTDQPTGSGG